MSADISPNVFLSWSGPRARAMAEALHGFLRRVIQSARPFHSDKDIAAGDFGDPEIRAALKTVVFAVVCCTPENVTAPWLNYEAGAIAERLEGSTAPLILGSKPEALDRSPIFRLQAREADRDGTLFVVQSLNAKLPQRLPDDILVEAFDTHWAKLNQTWKTIPAPATKTPARTDREMLEEVVGLCRQLTSERPFPNAVLASAYDALNSGSLGGRAFAERAMDPPSAVGFAWHSVRSTAIGIAHDLAEQLYSRSLTPDELEEILSATRRVFKKRGGNATEVGSVLAVEMMRSLGVPDPLGS